MPVESFARALAAFSPKAVPSLAGLQVEEPMGSRGPRGANRPSRAVITPRLLFVVLGVVAALAIILLSTQALVSERAHILEQRGTEANLFARFAATYQGRLYDQSERVARDVAARVEAGDMTDAQLHDYLKARTLDTTADDYIVVLDRNGRVRATSEDRRSTGMVFGSPTFATTWASTEHQIVPMLKSRITGAVIYSYSRRLQDRGGRFAGVVGVNVRPEGIRPTAKRRPQDPLLTVWGRDGRFIGASFADFDTRGQVVAPPKPHGLAIPGSPPNDDPGVISASLRVPGWPLVAVASFDKPGVLADWQRHVFETVSVIGLALLGLAALAWLGVKTANREAAALEQRDLLMKEVHHRVKNSLSMTAGLLYLQERRFKDPAVREAFESTRRRLNSIGLVHEALYADDHPDRVDLSQYLPRLVGEIAHGYDADARKVSVVTEVEAIEVAAANATPIGLIVTEVLTNAFKHAFTEGASGQIDLKVYRSAPGALTVEIADNGKGYPSRARQGQGLGTRVITALADQLRADVERINAGGALFRLTFPL